MKFTSLTTAIITVAAMANAVIASGGEDVPSISCAPNQTGCSRDTNGINNGNDFGYTCGSNGFAQSWNPCSCKGCCTVIRAADGTYVTDCT